MIQVESTLQVADNSGAKKVALSFGAQMPPI